MKLLKFNEMARDIQPIYVSIDNLLKYTANELKNHLENLFTDGMSWSNYGEWQVDHIKSLYTFVKKNIYEYFNEIYFGSVSFSTVRMLGAENHINHTKCYKACVIWQNSNNWWTKS